MRQKNINRVSQYIDPLITEEPLNPYFWELKAQALLESNNIKDAVIAYKQALDLKPSSDLFKINYAEAKLASSPNKKAQQELIPLLEQANRNNNTPEAFHLLGQIYSNLGEHGISNYYLAEYNHATGNDSYALKMVSKALHKPLRTDIQLRALDLKERLKEKTSPKKTLL
jgi:predicted Zn-dependent protease